MVSTRINTEFSTVFNSIVMLCVHFLLSFAAISMIVGCVAFPFGWNSNEFRKICGPESNRFEIGPICGIRWAYPLAIIGNFLSSIRVQNCVHVIELFVSSFQVALMHAYWPHWHSYWPHDMFDYSPSQCIRIPCSKVLN